MNEATMRLSVALADRYVVEREIGQGGMATVYLARDVRHGRQVALKVLRRELAAVIGGERFLQEIRTTANLQHPHILPLFDSGEIDGTVFYVMPFVDGESLRDRLNREKQLPVREAVRIADEAASALDYAHRRGVVHRDIKPENILLQDGQALIADFGIALAVVRSDNASRMTETGMSLGTPHYMSPEQAMGERTLDARTDIYSLGCVVYEMLAGEPPFTGPTAQAIVARVVTEEPRPLVLQRRTIPPHVEAAIRKCLEKTPADRFATAGEFAAALSDPASISSTAAFSTAAAALREDGTPTLRDSVLRIAPWALAAVMALLAALAWLRPTAPTAAPPIERFTLTFARGAELSDAPGSPVALSPDASAMVYVGTDSQGVGWLFLRRSDSPQPAPIPGTRQALRPFFSPDGQWIGFNQDGLLKKVSLSGGAVATIAEPDGGAVAGASWGRDDIVVFGANGRLYTVSAAGGAPELLAAPDSSEGEATAAYRWPDLLPDGKAAVFTIVEGAGSALATVDLRTRDVRRLEQSGHTPFYVSSGHLTYVSENTLFAVPFDARRVRITGRPRPIVDNVRVGPAQIAKVGMARTGSFVYLGGSTALRELVLIDRGGRIGVLPLPTDRYRYARFSPDARRIAVGIDHGVFPSSDIWVYDIASRNISRVTFDSASAFPEWVPDGRHIAYSRLTRPLTFGLYRIVGDGSGAPESLLVRTGSIIGVQFTPDARQLLFVETSRETRRDIWMKTLDADGPIQPLLRTPFHEYSVTLSPDGAWVAYVSDETGSDQIYVRQLAPTSPRWRVSTRGGNAPRWARGGRELIFRTGDSLYVSQIQFAPEFSAGEPRALFSVAGFMSGFDVTRDGERFVAVRTRNVESGREELNVVLHWFDNLRNDR